MRSAVITPLFAPAEKRAEQEKDRTIRKFFEAISTISKKRVSCVEFVVSARILYRKPRLLTKEIELILPIALRHAALMMAHQCGITQNLEVQRATKPRSANFTAQVYKQMSRGL